LSSFSCYRVELIVQITDKIITVATLIDRDCQQHSALLHSLHQQSCSINVDQEYNNVRSWSSQNKLSVNTDKTKEIIFHRPAARNLTVPPPLTGIQEVKQAELLGIDVTYTLSTVAYGNKLLMHVNQHLYLLSLLQSSGLQRSSLHLLFNAVVINRLMIYPRDAGQLTADDKTGLMLYQERPCDVD